MMPANRTDPRAGEVMREVGLGIYQVPRAIKQQMLTRANKLILMGADINPQAFPMAQAWDFEDLKSDALDEFRLLRDEIRTSVRELIQEMRLEDLDPITTELEWRSLMEVLLSA